MPYRVIDDPGAESNEVVAVVQGHTLFDLFENAALAVFDLTVGIDRIRIERDVPVMAVGDTPDELLADWLIQIMLVAHVHHLVVTSVTVDRLETGGMQGAVGGFHPTAPDPVRFVPSSAGPDGPIVTVPDGHWVKVRIR